MDRQEICAVEKKPHRLLLDIWQQIGLLLIFTLGRGKVLFPPPTKT